MIARERIGSTRRRGSSSLQTEQVTEIGLFILPAPKIVDASFFVLRSREMNESHPIFEELTGFFEEIVIMYVSV